MFRKRGKLARVYRNVAVTTFGKERRGKEGKNENPSPKILLVESQELLLLERGRIEKMYRVDEMPNETINEENCFLECMRR